MKNRLQLDKHPIQFVRRTVASADKAAILEFGFYWYEPHKILDKRISVDLQLQSITDLWLQTALEDLAEGQELAFQSLVRCGGKLRHLPMIDLGGRSDEFRNLPVLREFMSYWGMNFAVYSSGRSFHLYGNRLLAQSDWVRFMGTLLLLNVPGKSRLIDNRWVGHRLLGGRSALRWSNNTTHYKGYPKFIGMLEELIE